MKFRLALLLSTSHCWQAPGLLRPGLLRPGLLQLQPRCVAPVCTEARRSIDGEGAIDVDVEAIEVIVQEELKALGDLEDAEEQEVAGGGAGVRTRSSSQ